MSQTHFFDQFLKKAVDGGRTRMFGSEEGLRLATLPTPSPAAVQLPFTPINVPRGQHWVDMRYIGDGVFVRRDLWLISLTHRLSEATRRLLS